MMKYKDLFREAKMTFETLNNNVILVELSRDEMRKYNITYEALDNQDTNTRVAIRKLLDHIDTEKSIRNSRKVVVETLPIEGGGCFFIFTFMQVRRKYKLKKHEEIRLFSLENLNDFLDLICTIRKNPDKDVFLTAYEMGNDYFVAKKRNTWLSVLKAILVIAVIAFVAYKIYDKFFKKKVQQEVLGSSENGDAAIAESSEGSAE
jgi:hypothetical protein